MCDRNEASELYCFVIWAVSGAACRYDSATGVGGGTQWERGTSCSTHYLTIGASRSWNQLPSSKALTLQNDTHKQHTHTRHQWCCQDRGRAKRPHSPGTHAWQSVQTCVGLSMRFHPSASRRHAAAHGGEGSSHLSSFTQSSFTLSSLTASSLTQGTL
jgi:hypothetical protein